MNLQKFYNDYAAWLDKGAPEGQPFSRRMGLCSQAMKPQYDVPINELKKQFLQAGLDPKFPFGGTHRFDMDLENATMHLNPKRIKWVKDRVNL